MRLTGAQNCTLFIINQHKTSQCKTRWFSEQQEEKNQWLSARGRIPFNLTTKYDVNFTFWWYPKFKQPSDDITTYGTLNNWWWNKQWYQENTMQGKAATAEQWTDTSLLWCFAHNAVQCCSADAAMHDTLQGSSCALLWFHELCSFLFYQLYASSVLSHTLRRSIDGGGPKTEPTADWF